MVMQAVGKPNGDAPIRSTSSTADVVNEVPHFTARLPAKGRYPAVLECDVALLQINYCARANFVRLIERRTTSGRSLPLSHALTAALSPTLPIQPDMPADFHKNPL
jgi:hypothetical protein